jgi:hypothetical protein
MKGRRTAHEIYWEILVFCRTLSLFYQYRQPLRSQLKDRGSVPGDSNGRRYLSVERSNGKTLFRTTEDAQKFLTLFTILYRTLFDENPGFRI